MGGSVVGVLATINLHQRPNGIKSNLRSFTIFTRLIDICPGISTLEEFGFGEYISSFTIRSLFIEPGNERSTIGLRNADSYYELIVLGIRDIHITIDIIAATCLAVVFQTVRISVPTRTIERHVIAQDTNGFFPLGNVGDVFILDDVIQHLFGSEKFATAVKLPTSEFIIILTCIVRHIRAAHVCPNYACHDSVEDRGALARSSMLSRLEGDGGIVLEID